MLTNGAVRENLEPIVRRSERLVEGAHSLSLGLDRTTIPMEELADPDRKSPVRSRRAPYLRKALRWMMQDVRWMRRTRRNLPVLAVQDAAPEMWSLVVGALVAEPSARA